LDRKADVVTPIPPNVETRRKPIEEQLAHVLESTLNVDPERNDLIFIFKPFERLSTYTFILTTTPKRIAVILDRIKPVTTSSGK
jgi:hypothetical protein